MTAPSSPHRDADRKNYSAKHRHHGLHFLALTDARGRLIWISAARPGRTHDNTAARHDHILAHLRAADLGALANLAFRGLDNDLHDPVIVTGFPPSSTLTPPLPPSSYAPCLCGCWHRPRPGCASCLSSLACWLRREPLRASAGAPLRGPAAVQSACAADGRQGQRSRGHGRRRGMPGQRGLHAACAITPMTRRITRRTFRRSGQPAPAKRSATERLKVVTTTFSPGCGRLGRTPPSHHRPDLRGFLTVPAFTHRVGGRRCSEKSSIFRPTVRRC
ncbi:transposase family protein [Streptomyces sp. NPDC005811]|uniref:transposase family protein n=1 Tax=Streptomyces sp. NPDC005811 TaxID=3154565 RepID=UPI0033C3748E